MKKSIRLQWLESELERLRMKLYQATGKEPIHHLSHSRALPISQQLDLVIVEFLKEKNRQKNC